MASDADETTAANAYVLSCADCSFETIVKGTVRRAFDVADAHQEEHEDSDSEHFVNLERSNIRG